MKYYHYIIIVVFMGICLFGCVGGDVKISEIGPLPEPVIETLPLKIGIYYDDELRNFNTTEESYPYPTYNIQFGKTNLMLFDFIFTYAFREVISVHDLRKETLEIENLDAVLEIGIHDYHYDAIPEGVGLDCYVTLTYSVTFHTTNLSSPNAWLISGQGYVLCITKSLSTGIKEATKIAMRDAAAQFLTGFCDQAEAKKMFNRQCQQ